jgi:hypothetical protein
MVSSRRHISTFKGVRSERNSPGIPIQAHDDTFDPSALGGIRAFIEQLVNLFLCCVETQVADLPVVSLMNV